MDMSYNGALEMPSSYAKMDEEEMSYTEGGGTIGFRFNASTVEFLCTSGAGVASAAITAAMGSTGIGAVVAAAVGPIVYKAIMDCCGCEYHDVDLTYSAWYLPNAVIEWNS